MESTASRATWLMCTSPARKTQSVWLLCNSWICPALLKRFVVTFLAELVCVKVVLPIPVVVHLSCRRRGVQDCGSQGQLGRNVEYREWERTGLCSGWQLYHLDHRRAREFLRVSLYTSLPTSFTESSRQDWECCKRHSYLSYTASSTCEQVDVHVIGL